MTIRESIILEARELAEGSPSKDTRSFARSVYEYLGNMTHNEAIKTARDALYCIEKGLEWHNRTTPKTIAREALTALESLTETSKPLDPTIQAVVQENFWELAGKQEPSDCLYTDTPCPGYTQCAYPEKDTHEGKCALSPKAVEPSGGIKMENSLEIEDARELYFRLLLISPDGDKSISFITERDKARDERIRRECESESNSIISDLLDVFDALNGKKYMTADRGRKIIDNARAAITGKEPL